MPAARFATVLGDAHIAWLMEGADCVVGRLRLPGGALPSGTDAMPPAVAAVAARIAALLAGAGGADDLADVPLDGDAWPAFDRRVWAAARAIPPGQTRTYGELATAIGEPGAARAVGAALGRNPFAPVVPCHRVLAAGGAAGGFSAPGGVATKLKMLEAERARFGSEPGLFD